MVCLDSECIVYGISLIGFHMFDFIVDVLYEPFYSGVGIILPWINLLLSETYLKD